MKYRAVMFRKWTVRFCFCAAFLCFIGFEVCYGIIPHGYE